MCLRDEPYDRGDIAEELLLIEREIDDEGSGEGVMGPSRPIYRTSIGLTYPHWRCGTLPLTVRTRGLFPVATNHHTPVVLVDAQSGNKMQGWVVHEELVCLWTWLTGTSATGCLLEHTSSWTVREILGLLPWILRVRRLKHLWGKVAVAQGDRLEFQVRKLPIACEHDEQLTISEDNPKEIDELWARMKATGDEPCSDNGAADAGAR